MKMLPEDRGSNSETFQTKRRDKCPIISTMVLNEKDLLYSDFPQAVSFILLFFLFFFSGAIP